MPVPVIPKKQKPIVDMTNCTPAWMVTMGDAMSLLLCFFVMLLNFGSLHSDELINVFGVLTGSREIASISGGRNELARWRQSGPDENAPVVLRRAGIPRHLGDLQRRLAAEGYTHQVHLAELDHGMRIRFAAHLLFQEDGGLAPAGRRLLRDVVNILQGTANEIRLTAALYRNGTDAEAAYEKTRAVADFLVAEGGLSRSRLSCGAHGIDYGREAFFDLMLMEKADTKQLKFADLWDAGGQ